MGENEPIIQVANLTKTFNGTTAVDDLSFTVQPGEIFGFIGPSGCGKTTTIRVLTGVHAPTKGETRVLGVSPQRFGQRQRERIGYMPQLFVLYPTLSVEENLNFAASLYGMGWLSRRKRRREVLEFVELWDHRHKLARDISGGMQRRLELASCLIHRPALVFLDEPTAGIDPVLRATLWDGFRQLKAEGRTLFVTTQYVTEAEYCDRVAVMSAGRLIALDAPDGLRTSAFGGEMIDIKGVHMDEPVLEAASRVPGYRRAEIVSPGHLRLVFDDAEPATAPLLAALRGAGGQIDSVNVYRPNFDEVFVRLVEGDRSDA